MEKNKGVWIPRKTDKDICDGVEDAVCDYQSSHWATVKVGVVKAGNGTEEAHSAWRERYGCYRDVN